MTSALNFSNDDLKSNRRGVFSDEQRNIVVMLGKITRAQHTQYAPTAASRSTTQSLPQIQVATGHVQVICETRFLRGNRIDFFYLIVHSAGGQIELPVTEVATRAFEPNRDYSVYFYLNREIPTLLSAYVAE